MAGINVSQCFIDYLEVMGGASPSCAKRVHKCYECKKIMNGYQAAISHYCCNCVQRFKEIEDENGIYHHRDYKGES